jgi:hypothetical protein
MAKITSQCSLKQYNQLPKQTKKTMLQLVLSLEQQSQKYKKKKKFFDTNYSYNNFTTYKTSFIKPV